MSSKICLNIIATVIFGFLISCTTDFENGPLIVGEDFTNTKIRVVSIDTFTVKMSTIKFDSIVTSATGRLLFGNYKDDNFGEVSASSFFELTGSNYSIEEEGVIDSVGIVFGYDTYFYNDTTQILNLKAHKLLSRLDTDNDNFYNTSEIDFDSSPLADISFYPEPNSDSLYIPLPFEFGKNIFEGIKNKEIEDDESLLQVLKGLTIQSNNNDDGAVIGFAVDKSYIRIYYNIPGELEDEEKEFDLIINSNSALSHFNNIQSNVSSLPIHQLLDQEDELLSIDSNNLGYLQSGVGYATKIEFPSIKKINELTNSGTFLSATLYLMPNRTSYSEIKPIEESLDLYITNQNNDVIEQIMDVTGNFATKFEEEVDEFNQALYTIPVLEFVDRKLLERPETQDALVLLPAQYNATVNSLLFNDALGDDLKTKLVVTYAIYGE